MNLFTASINTGTQQRSLPIIAGRAIFILGRNGTGKSALVHNLVSQMPRTVYIPGSRPSYFDNDSLQMTPAARRQMENSWVQWDRQPTTRYRPINGTQRNEKAILDLQSGETQFKVDAANEIAALGISAPALERLRSESSPYDRVNSLARQANLPTRIVMVGGEMMAQRSGSPYSIAKMSDGERSALIISSDVLSAPSMSIFVIDEPELHLHRSIVVPLISSLIAERTDCAFIVSTHELELPSAKEDCTTVLVRGCNWNADNVEWWDVDIIEGFTNIPDEIRVDILGSRRKILFVEGSSTSLDQPLYALIFPSVSIRPKGTARDVRHAVKAMREVEPLHHARAYGIVDNDGMDAARIEKLRIEGVFALAMSSVESIYYCEDAVRSVAALQSGTLGLECEPLVSLAKAAAIDSLRGENCMKHLASYVAELKTRSSIMDRIPTGADLAANPAEPVAIDIPNLFDEEMNKIRSLVVSSRYDDLVAKYPIRESGLRRAVAGALRFRDHYDYEKAELGRVARDELLRSAILTRLGHAAQELS